MFIPTSTFSDLATFVPPPHLFQSPRLLERWEYDVLAKSGVPYVRTLDITGVIYFTNVFYIQSETTFIANMFLKECQDQNSRVKFTVEQFSYFKKFVPKFVASEGLGGALVPPPPVFGRTVNSISTRGTDRAHQSTTTSPPPKNFQSLRRPCHWHV